MALALTVAAASLAGATGCSDDGAPVVASASSVTSTSAGTATSGPAATTATTTSAGAGSTSTLPPDDGTLSQDPGEQATQLGAMLDEDPEDVCTARRVLLGIDTMTGPATPEQAQAQIDLRVRVIGAVSSLAPDELAGESQTLTATALALGADARAHAYDPVYVRSAGLDVLQRKDYLAALGTIRKWMDGECGNEPF